MTSDQEVAGLNLPCTWLWIEGSGNEDVIVTVNITPVTAVLWPPEPSHTHSLSLSPCLTPTACLSLPVSAQVCVDRCVEHGRRRHTHTHT